ncbi:MAG TPA: c-type cytochrome [Parasegetibacter sp.]
MRKVFKVTGIVIGIILVLIVGAVAYISAFLPNVGDAPDLKIVSTPEKVERGRYLANHVMVCVDCHSTRDWNYFAGPMKRDSIGKGGERFDHTMGFPGVIYSPNITPAGIGDWTDGEIFRAITTGVRKNGKPIFPVMPYHNYGMADPEDIEAIICYLRELDPIDYKTPESTYDFPVNFLVNTMPQKASFTKRPDTSDVVEYGRYLVNAASCGDCHTPFENGKYKMELQFAGGRSFDFPAGVVTSVNLTPDDETGIGLWTKEVFLDKFRVYRDSAFAHRPVNIMKEYTSLMPWEVYAGMTDSDLGAIYEYLKSLKPIKNEVVRFVERSQK